MHGRAVDADAVEILDAREHPLGVGGKRAVVVVCRHARMVEAASPRAAVALVRRCRAANLPV